MLVDNLLWVLGVSDTEVGEDQLFDLKGFCLVEEGQLSKTIVIQCDGVQWRGLLQRRRLDST